MSYTLKITVLSTTNLTILESEIISVKRYLKDLTDVNDGSFLYDESISITDITNTNIMTTEYYTTSIPFAISSTIILTKAKVIYEMKNALVFETTNQTIDKILDKNDTTKSVEETKELQKIKNTLTENVSILFKIKKTILKQLKKTL
jgi:hypothetical protein